MANSFDTVQDAISEKYIADNWLNTHTNGLFFNLGPENDPFPYCTFYLDSKFMHNNKGKSQQFELQFNIYSNSKDKKEIGNISENMKRVYEGKELTVTGYKNSVFPVIVDEQKFVNETKVNQGVLKFSLRINND